MALKRDDAYNLLKEFSKYGATIYYLLDIKKIELDDITSILYKDTLEQVALVFPSFIKKIDVDDIDEAISKYEMDYTKFDCLSSIINRDNDTHQHLKDTIDIVNFGDKIDELVKTRIYHSALNVKYIGLILERINKSKSKAFISVRETTNLYLEVYNKLRMEIEDKISDNIDNYYISSITN